MARHQRRKIATGIYTDKYGIAIIVTVRGTTKEIRRPHGIPLATLKTERARLKLELTGTAPTTPARGSLERDIQTYLGLVKHLAGWTERRSELRAWIALYGHRPRHSLERADVLAARAAWLAGGRDAEPVSAKTINNRVTALRALYHELDGHDAPTPADGIRSLPFQRQPPIDVPAATIAAVYQRLIDFENGGRLRDRKTRARFRMRAETGRRPSEIMRAQPGDFDLVRRIWHIRDGKGGFTPGGLYLTDSILDAVRLFIDADAFGPFNTGSMAEVLHAAGWPRDVRPYNLRHSIGIALADAGADHMDIAAALGHRDPRTSRRHYIGIRDSRTRAALEKIDGRIDWESAPTSDRRRA
jgi:integrase